MLRSLRVDGDKLYNGCKTLIKEHLEALAEERIVPAFPRGAVVTDGARSVGGAEAVERAMEGERFLRAVKGVWDDHNVSMRLFAAIVRYMVRPYLLCCACPLSR